MKPGYSGNNRNSESIWLIIGLLVRVVAYLLVTQVDRSKFSMHFFLFIGLDVDREMECLGNM